MLHIRRTRSEKEVKKHVQRRKKRKRDKATELPEDGQDASVAAAAAQEAQDDVTASDLLAPLQVIKVLAHAMGANGDMRACASMQQGAQSWV